MLPRTHLRPSLASGLTIFLLLACILSMFYAASLGAVAISFEQLLDLTWPASTAEVDPVMQRILFDIRMPRVLLAFAAGGGLALCGAILQTVTRNPLADPYLFGISSGASLGAVAVTALFGVGAVLLPLGAFLGSALAILLMIGMATGHASVQVERMLLGGVAVSFMLGAATNLLLYTLEPHATASVLFWSLGSFARASWPMLPLPLLTLLFALLLATGFARPLNALLTGDESAHSLGINVRRLRIGMLLLASLLGAVMVANCGGIGFVGLMIPHIVRLLLGVGVMRNLLATVLLGGLFMVWVDVLARTLLAQQELPVGVITAAIGSLFFLGLLFRNQRGING